MLTLPTLTRRTFVKTGGFLVVSIAALPDALREDGVVHAATLDATDGSSWLDIRSDGRITARTGRAEMGIGVAACYRQMIAEELFVRPEWIDLVMADTDRTPDGGWSASLMDGAENQRKVAAYAREMLIELAATALGASVASLSIKDGIISAGTKSISYAELLRGRQLELKIPISGDRAQMNEKGTSIQGTMGLTVTGTPRSKPMSEYTVIGTSFPSPSIEQKVTGKTEWVGDLRLPDMLHARMVRPATLGSTLVSVGTLNRNIFPSAEVVRKNNLLAVVSPNEWEAVGAARALAATTRWSEWAGMTSSDQLGQALRSRRQEGGKRGDLEKTEAAFASAAKVVNSAYEQAYVKHAPIAAFVAVADVKADGNTLVYAHSAQSQGLRVHLAHILGVPPDKVTVRWLEGAGQYGRTSMGGDGAEADAAILSQMLGKPVRVQWTLAEDFAWSSQSFGWAADMKVGLDVSGRLVALRSDFITGAGGGDVRTVGAVLAGMPDLPAPRGAGGGPANAAHHTGPAKYYDIPAEFHQGYGARLISVEPPSSIGLRTHIMRTPGQRQHVCALESAINEAAAAAGADPGQFRIDHTGDRRFKDIIRKTLDAAGWKPRSSPNPAARRTGAQPVTGRGMAVIFRMRAYWAAVAEVEVVPLTGVVTVKSFTIGVDPGKVVNPIHLQRNCEGGVMMGIGEALMEELTFDEGKITSTDWTLYRIPTMADTPVIKVVTISRDDVGFGGVAEAANALPQPCILAAVFDATGVQPRKLPLTPEYVRSILKG